VAHNPFPGLYEQLVTQELSALLQELESGGVDVTSPDVADGRALPGASG